MIPGRESPWTRRMYLLPALVILLYLAVFALINFPCFSYFCEPDMYADTLVAKLMWEDKSLFPHGYMFGNQLYIVATPVLSALFYGLTGSPNTAMGLATTVMTALIVLSFLWALRPWAGDRLTALSALLLLVSCAFGDRLVRQEAGQLLFIMCSYYACYLIVLLLVLGDYCRSLSDPGPRRGCLALCLALSFAAGMQSLRQTCIMVLPILAFEGLACLRELRQGAELRSLLRRRSLRRALAYGLADLMGLIFVRLLPVHQYTIFDAPGQSLAERLEDLYLALRTITGFAMAQPDRPFFILLFCCQIGLLAWGAWIAIKDRRWQDGPWCMWWILVISLLAVIAASLVTSLKIRGVYLFTYYPLLALSGVLVLRRISPRRARLLCLGLCALALVNLGESYLPDVEEGLTAPMEPTEEISLWAVENGYELVYGGHAFVAPKIAAYSDGKLTSGAWNDEVMFKAQEYLNLQNIYSEEDVTRAIFVFSPGELDYAFEAAANGGGELELQGRYGELSVYTSTVQLMYPRTYPWFDKQWDLGQYDKPQD